MNKISHACENMELKEVTITLLRKKKLSASTYILHITSGRKNEIQSVHLSQILDKRLLKVDNQHKPICFLIVEYTCYLFNNNLSIANIKPLN